MGCHQFGMLERDEVLDRAAPGATLLLNTHHSADAVWDALSRRCRSGWWPSGSTLYVIDAGRIARDAGLAGRTNTVLQTCFFAISGVLEPDRAIEAIKASIARPTAAAERRWSSATCWRSTSALEGLHRVALPARATPTRGTAPIVPEITPRFVRTVTAAMMAGHGDELPVSALPVDGTYPSGTTKYEKRNISDLVAVWDAELCIQCGNCSFVCPHSVIRSRYCDPDAPDRTPPTPSSRPR